MAAVNNSPTTLAGIFKRSYENVRDILPQGYAILEVAPFESRLKAGELVQVPVIVSAENGVTMGSSGILTFNDVQAGAVKAAQITPYQMFVSSGISCDSISRSATDAQAVRKATKTVVDSNLRSHMRFLAQTALYGQDSQVGLGRICYDASTFRGVSISATGGATIGGVTFTAGVNTSSKHILLNPLDIAAGLWIGSEGMEIEQRAASDDAVVSGGSGKVVSVDIRNGIIKVDFTPVAASASGSHYLTLKAAALTNSQIGVKAILKNATTMFNIDAAAVSMFKGIQIDNGAKKLSWAIICDALAAMADKGLDSEAVVLTSFESWSDLLSEQSALRSYDQSYDPSKLQQGAKSLEFSFVNGAVMVKPDRFVRRGDTFILPKKDLHRYGSADVGMGVPGMEDDLLVKPITTSAFIFRSFSDQQIFLDAPGRAVYMSNINPESAT